MIKATELRIGNLVDTFNGVDTIESITSHEVFLVNNYSKFLLDKIYPIDLHQKWFDRLGFNNQRQAEEMEIVNFIVCIDCFPFIHMDTGIELKYVHQLQNLFFALTGEELTLKDSKKEMVKEDWNDIANGRD